MHRYILTILELKVLKQEDEVNTLVLSQLAESRRQNKFGESRLSPLQLPSENRGSSLLHSPTGYQSDIYQVTLQTLLESIMLEAMRIKKKFMKPLHLLFPLPGWFRPSSILSFLGLSSTSPPYHQH